MDDFERAQIYGGGGGQPTGAKKYGGWLFVIFLNVCMVAFFVYLAIDIISSL